MVAEPFGAKRVEPKYRTWSPAEVPSPPGDEYVTSAPARYASFGGLGCEATTHAERSSVVLEPCLRIVEVPTVTSELGMTPLNDPLPPQGKLNAQAPGGVPVRGGRLGLPTPKAVGNNRASQSAGQLGFFSLAGH